MPKNVTIDEAALKEKFGNVVLEAEDERVAIKFSQNDKDTQMSSFADGASNQQIIVKNIRGGVRVEYTIGREEVIYLAPRLIRKEKLEALRDQIKENSPSARDYKSFMAFYLIKDLDDPGISDKTKKEMEEAYPITKQFPVYVCEPAITTQELLRLERWVKNYTTYDYETLEADHAETEYVASDDVPPLFKLALEYRVDGEEITKEEAAMALHQGIFDDFSLFFAQVIIKPIVTECQRSGHLTRIKVVRGIPISKRGCCQHLLLGTLGILYLSGVEIHIRERSHTFQYASRKDVHDVVTLEFNDVENGLLLQRHIVDEQCTKILQLFRVGQLTRKEEVRNFFESKALLIHDSMGKVLDFVTTVIELSVNGF